MGARPAGAKAEKKQTEEAGPVDVSKLTGRARSLANLRPWTSETAPRSGGRPPGAVALKTVIAQMLDGPAPTHLRVRLAKHIGVSLDVLDGMSMKEIVAAKLAVGFLKDDKLDWLRELLDRDAPKSRRVEVEGTVDHHHSVSRLEAGMTEEEAGAVYRDMLGGGRVLDVAAHPVEPTGSPEPAASSPEESAQVPEPDADK